MKKYLILSFLLFTGIGAFAQKFAYVDTEYILQHLPEYKAAVNQLTATSEQFQVQVDGKY
jgi:outer membrane protein